MNSIVTNVQGLSVNLSLAKTQAAMRHVNNELATGLRVSGPADDPSGYAIATKMEVQAASLDASTQSMQNSRNAVTVATGALQTITGIVQRIRTLVISAESSLLSSNDLTHVQTEITQLTAEINTIAANTQFNGTSLLNGYFGGVSMPLDPFVVQSGGGIVNTGSASGGLSFNVTATMPSKPASGAVLVAALAFSNGYNDTDFSPGHLTAPPGWTLVDNDDGQNTNDYNAGLAIYTRVADASDTGSYTWNVTTTAQGNVISLAVLETKNVDATKPIAASAHTETYHGSFSSEQLTTPAVTATQSNQLPLGFHTSYNDNPGGSAVGTGWSVVARAYNSSNDVAVEAGPLSTAAGDTRQSIFQTIGSLETVSTIALFNPATYTRNNEITTATDANEGARSGVALPSTSVQQLDLQDIDVTKPTADYLTTIDTALNTLTTLQTSLGSYLVGLTYASSNAQLASVNTTASMSTIRDANIAQVVSQNTKDALLQSFGTSLLVQTNSAAYGVLKLFTGQ